MAWTKIALFVAEKIKEGYTEHTRQVKRDRMRQRSSLTPKMAENYTLHQQQQAAPEVTVDTIK